MYVFTSDCPYSPQKINSKNEVVFLVMEPGNYSAQITLDFTLCDGLRDPPEDWIIKGLELKKSV